MRRQLIVVGNGMAAGKFLELLQHQDHQWAVAVFGDEPRPAYDRIALSKVLAGASTADEILLHDHEWYRRAGIELETGRAIVSCDPESRVIEDAKGRKYRYDALVLATGSLPLLPPIPGIELDGVLGFRTLDDVERMIAAARSGGAAVVIGGGLLGLECARGLQQRGMEVTVVHLMDRLMERQLDAVAAGMLREELERMGLRFRLETTAEAIYGQGRVAGVRLSSGESLAADLVVVCTGIRPNVGPALGRLRIDKGIVVDDRLHTSAAHVYAIGECIEHRGQTFGLVDPVYEQAAVLARIIAREEALAYKPRLSATVLKVAGVDVYAGGRPAAEEGDQEVVLRDDAAFVYKKLVLRQGVVVGATLLGDVRSAPRVSAALATGSVVDDRLELLGMGGNGHSVPGEDLPDAAIVCGCNGVTKAEIVAAISRPDGCTSRACVARCTRASASCGSCAPVVEGLLKLAGRSPASDPTPAICRCLPLSRRQLRQLVLAEGIRRCSQVLERYGDGVGCHRCRPAINYYLDVWWCGEHEEEVANRHVNDRVHANVQRDGSFSVVPRMRGGITSPAELRRIAEVAERFGVGMVKLTGGQRIDLLGVRKSDLPKIWSELGLPSGHAYTKAIRTVKSCVGSDWCRFGVGDSTALAVALEEMLEGLYCPHKVKLGVTGCPRNCAEVTVKDVGIMAVSGAWEVYVGGAAGMTVRKADLLSTRRTPEEVLDDVAIAVQYYREEADYLERLYHFVPRIGIDAFREATVEAPAEQRRRLRERFQRAKANAVDPWRTVPAREPWRFAEPLAVPASA